MVIHALLLNSILHYRITRLLTQKLQNPESNSNVR